MSGDVIGQPGMKLTVLGSGGETKLNFSCTNTTPSSPSFTATGQIDGGSIETSYCLNEKILHVFVEINNDSSAVIHAGSTLAVSRRSVVRPADNSWKQVIMTMFIYMTSQTHLMFLMMFTWLTRQKQPALPVPQPALPLLPSAPGLPTGEY